MAVGRFLPYDMVGGCGVGTSDMTLWKGSAEVKSVLWFIAVAVTGAFIAAANTEVTFSRERIS